MKRSLLGFSGVAVFVLGLACDDPATDLTEWTVADHTHQTEKGQKGQRKGGAAATKLPTYSPPSKRDMLIEVTWSKQCANCHGKRGRGDGPQSPMVKAKDLTSIEWQATVSDEQLTESIKKGKGKMPAFNLPESVVAGLVTHIRTLPEKNKKGFPQNKGAAPAPGATPAAGAAAAAGAGAAAAAAAPAPSAVAPPPAAPPAPPSEEEDEAAEGDNAH
jgi:cytochrome c oxidase cbb3-type subunit 3